jgi:transposase
LILPWCNTAMMNLHLAAISTDVAPGRHAVLLLDQAGWHLSDKLVMPHNITIVPLPPKCPELNPQENVWQFIRDNWLSNRVFENAERNPRSLLQCLEQARSSAPGPSCLSACAIGPIGSDQ